MTGPIVGGIILVATLIIAVWYLNETKNPTLVGTLSPVVSTEATDPTVSSLQTLGTSDEPAAIQDDLEATDLDGIMAYINAI